MARSCKGVLSAALILALAVLCSSTGCYPSQSDDDDANTHTISFSCASDVECSAGSRCSAGRCLPLCADSNAACAAAPKTAEAVAAMMAPEQTPVLTQPGAMAMHTDAPTDAPAMSAAPDTSDIPVSTAATPPERTPTLADAGVMDTLEQPMRDTGMLNVYPTVRGTVHYVTGGFPVMTTGPEAAPTGTDAEAYCFEDVADGIASFEVRRGILEFDRLSPDLQGIPLTSATLLIDAINTWRDPDSTLRIVVSQYRADLEITSDDYDADATPVTTIVVRADIADEHWEIDITDIANAHFLMDEPIGFRFQLEDEAPATASGISVAASLHLVQRTVPPADAGSPAQD